MTKAFGGLLKPNPVEATQIPKISFEADELLTEDELITMLGGVIKKQWLADHRTRVEPIIPHVKMGKEIRYPKLLCQRWYMGLIETRPRWERGTPTQKRCAV